jgi:hypothetical protein
MDCRQHQGGLAAATPAVMKLGCTLCGCSHDDTAMVVGHATSTRVAETRPWVARNKPRVATKSAWSLISHVRHAEADPWSVAVAVLADPDPSLLGKDAGVDAGRIQQDGRGRGRTGA